MEFKLGNIRLDRLKFDTLYANYLGMTPREQTMTLVVGAVILLLVIVLPIVVATRSLSSLERQIAEGREGLGTIAREIEAYHTQRAKLDVLETSFTGGFDDALATTMESLASTAGIADRIDSLKAKATTPTELFEKSSVDVRLKKVGLEEMLTFLFEIEHHPEKVLRLDTLDLKPRFDSKNEFDASFTVSTYRLLTEGEQ